MNDELVNKRILETVASLARYEIDIWTQVGPGVQATLIDLVSALSIDARIRDRDLVLAVCEAALSSEMEGTSWNANSVTLRTGTVPISPDIIKIRERAIAILFGLYKAATTDSDRRKVLAIARQGSHTGTRTEVSDDWLNLALNNSTRVVEFLLAEAEPFSYELMQTLEHEYWYEYRRARDISHSTRVNCRESAKRLMLAVEKLRDKFNADPFFPKFKVLVGFESVFPYQWKERDDSQADDYDRQQNYRIAEATKYIESIEEHNEAEWFTLIESIASIKSNDMATFPSFARFLTEFAQRKPKSATRLMDQASDDAAAFFAAMLAGLHESNEGITYQKEVDRILQCGKFLAALARHLRYLKSPNIELSGKTLQRAMEVGHRVAVAECLIMAMEGKPENVPPKEEFFELAIKYLNSRREYWWVGAAWLPDEASAFFSSLSEHQADLLMPAIIDAPKISYYIEQILVQVARLYPKLVWDCFASRLLNKKETMPDRYEAIPYQFHGLQDVLSRNPKLAVKFGQQIFKEDSYLFRFRGGRLLSIAFPLCPADFAEALCTLIDGGTKEDVEFVLAILENYRGERTTQEILKRAITRFPNDENIRTGVIISLESTGVMSGEFGFANALREKLEIARGWQGDSRPEVRSFAEGHIQSLQLRIADEQRRAEERKALRELEYEQRDGTENE